MNSIASLTPVLRRYDFAGRNDVYASRVARSPSGSIEDALRGQAPFDAVGNIISENYRDEASSRLGRYLDYWQWYNGNHWLVPSEDGVPKPVFNFCKRITDRGVDWMLANGWRTVAESGNELIAEAVDKVWDSNQRSKLMLNAVNFGAVTGDSFFYVTVKTTDESGKELPKDQWRLVIDSLNPAHVFPIWSSRDRQEMSACYIQFPIVHEGQAKLYTLHITKTTWQQFLNDAPTAPPQPNLFGKVNVVHIPNLPNADSMFGVSDIEPIKRLNAEFNSVALTIRRIISYHAEPTTIIYGARASKLERGANRVWSNLPPPNEAKVENLQLQSDLEATYKYAEKLEQEICSLGETPKICLDGSDMRVSNTSGITMELMFKPLTDKTNRRRQSWSAGLTQVNELIIIGLENFFGIDMARLADKPAERYKTMPEFTSALPRDEAALTDLAVKRVEAKIWSRAEAIRRVSGVLDTNKLAMELAADQSSELAIMAEKARANQGMPVNFSAAFLSSACIAEDLEDLAARVAKEFSSAAEEAEADDSEDNSEDSPATVK